ncbi:MAG: hypothetical protein V4721_17910 [Bacteroidota bacterium]
MAAESPEPAEALFFNWPITGEDLQRTAGLAEATGIETAFQNLPNHNP